MSQTRITVTEEHATTRLTISPIGLQGAPGAGVPDGATDRQIAVYSAALSAWVPTSGFVPISVVDALPDPQVPGTLYMVKS